MKLEVGMFIRTPLGIDKIINLSLQDEYFGCYFDTQLEHSLLWHKEDNEFSIDGECFDKEEIKTSHNIIDLIEVGDYVNGQVVTQIMPNNRKIEPSTMIYTGTNYFVGLYNEDIETIVTKEQFESMSYKVGE